MKVREVWIKNAAKQWAVSKHLCSLCFHLIIYWYVSECKSLGMLMFIVKSNLHFWCWNEPDFFLFSKLVQCSVKANFIRLTLFQHEKYIFTVLFIANVPILQCSNLATFSYSRIALNKQDKPKTYDQTLINNC